MTCPSCLGSSLLPYSRDKRRSYILCLECSLVFVPRNELISGELEKARYDAHENNEEDEGYRSYLGNLAREISYHLSNDSRGLDFGSGRSALLEKLFREREIEVKSYDLFYHPSINVFESSYDFIILSEVIEHLREPRHELKKLRASLKPQGKWFVKTRLRPESASDFDNWFYKRDITHIQFYSLDSFRVLGEHLSMKGPYQVGEDLFLFRDDA